MGAHRKGGSGAGEVKSQYVCEIDHGFFDCEKNSGVIS